MEEIGGLGWWQVGGLGKKEKVHRQEQQCGVSQGVGVKRGVRGIGGINGDIRTLDLGSMNTQYSVQMCVELCP